MFGQGSLGSTDAQNRAAKKHELGNADVFGAKLSSKFKTFFYKDLTFQILRHPVCTSVFFTCADRRKDE